MPRKLVARGSQRLLIRRKFFSQANSARSSNAAGSGAEVAILGSLSAATVGGNHLDPMFSSHIQANSVVGTISDHALRQRAYGALAERVFDQRGFRLLAG